VFFGEVEFLCLPTHYVLISAFSMTPNESIWVYPYFTSSHTETDPRLCWTLRMSSLAEFPSVFLEKMVVRLICRVPPPFLCPDWLVDLFTRCFSTPQGSFARRFVQIPFCFPFRHISPTGIRKHDWKAYLLISSSAQLLIKSPEYTNRGPPFMVLNLQASFWKCTPRYPWIELHSRRVFSVFLAGF